MREFFDTLIALAEADSNVAHILRTHYWFVEQQLIQPDPHARARGLALVNSGAIVGNGFSEQSKRPVGLYFDTAFTPDPAGGYRLDGAKYYSTGSLYSDYTQIWASAPDGRIAGAVVPVDREGVTIEDDWDGFGQRLTATGTTRLENVHVAEDEYFDLGEPDGPQPPSYHGAFLQLYLQAVTAGVLASVGNDAVAWPSAARATSATPRRRRLRSEDRQVLQVVGEITADAFAAEAIVLLAAETHPGRVRLGRRRRPDASRPRRPPNSPPPRPRSPSTTSPTRPRRSCSTSAAPRRRSRSTTSTAIGATCARSRPTTRRS